MIELKCIEPAQFKWAALIVFAPKKDKTPQIRFEYSSLDALRSRDPYPRPRLEKSNDSPGKTTVFSTLDAHSEY